MEPLKFLGMEPEEVLEMKKHYEERAEVDLLTRMAGLRARNNDLEKRLARTVATLQELQNYLGSD